MDPIKLCGMGCCCVAFILLLVAVASNDWYASKDQYFGLWTVCSKMNKKCHSQGMNVPLYIHVIRAAIVTSTFLSLISCIGYFVSFYFPRIGFVPVLKICSIPSLLSGFFVLIAMGIFMALVEKEDKDFDSGSQLAWSCCGFLIMGGVLALRREPAREEYA